MSGTDVADAHEMISRLKFNLAEGVEVGALSAYAASHFALSLAALEQARHFAELAAMYQAQSLAFGRVGR